LRVAVYMLILTILGACGAFYGTLTPEQALEDFLASAGHDGLSLESVEIAYAQLPGEAVASQTDIITVDLSKWNLLSDCKRLIVIYHEAGHHYFSLPDSEGIMSDQPIECPYNWEHAKELFFLKIR